MQFESQSGSSTFIILITLDPLAVSMWLMLAVRQSLKDRSL